VATSEGRQCFFIESLFLEGLAVVAVGLREVRPEANGAERRSGGIGPGPFPGERDDDPLEGHDVIRLEADGLAVGSDRRVEGALEVQGHSEIAVVGEDVGLEIDRALWSPAHYFLDDHAI
jgi:hypothetical protein